MYKFFEVWMGEEIYHDPDSGYFCPKNLIGPGMGKYETYILSEARKYARKVAPKQEWEAS